MFLETSALTGENVEETFLKCARSILTKIESGKVCLSLKIFVLSYYVQCMRETYYTYREKFRNLNKLYNISVLYFLYGCLGCAAVRRRTRD